MSLKSKAFARILDLVSEGEIEGLANGAKSIYLDGTPLQSASGTYNFQDVTYDTRPGTQAQTYISGNPSVESEASVNTKVVNATPVVRSVSNADVNAVRVTVYTPAMYKQKDDGDLDGTDIQIAIDVQPNGGSYTEVLNKTITGKTTSKYQRSWRIDLTGSAPWNIRVRRITADSASAKLVNEIYWESITEIIDAKLRYPNSALVSIRFDAAAFSGIPTRGYDLKLKKVQVPVNYDPLTRVYTGTWNGTFKTAWTDNPAWCFYDLVTVSRYGLGDYIPAAQIDKWALYTIGQYCDELVPNGFGGTEPRFTCNLYLSSQEEAFKVINNLASCFRSMVYWASGSMTLSQDAPSDPVALFSQSNVVEGKFTYAGSSAKARHTVALVTWNDPADRYEKKVEYVEDADGISRYGIVPTEVVAFGCTSRGQANRVGRWLLYAERNETETVTFTTGIEGAPVRPGDVIKVADASRAGVRLGGRVSSATTTAITLDASVTLGATTWTLYAMLPDGSVASSQVVSAAGNTVNLLTALPAAPQNGAQWIMTTPNTEAQTFRVLNVVEKDTGEIEITALKHEPLKYDAVENGLVLATRDITELTPIPSAPTALTLTESLYTYQAEVRAKISVGWPNVQGAGSYRVQWSRDGSNFVDAVTSISDYEILNITPGVYEIRVYSIGATGKESTTYTTASITALGKTAPPANVTGLTAVTDANIGITLTWDKVADLDLDGYEIKDGATVLGIAKTTSFKIGLLPTGTKTYTVRALDTSGNYSATAASVNVTISAAAAPSVSAAFAGENVVLSWGAVQGTLATQAYEIRYGASWAAGISLGTIKGTSFSTKGTWSGARTFWVAAIDVANTTGAAGGVVATISGAAAPTISHSFAGENLVLSWTAVTGSLPTEFYEVRYGSTWAGGTSLGTIKATSLTVKAQWSGTRTFWVAATDTAGNVGSQGSAGIIVNSPAAVTITQEVIDNNVLLKWGDATATLPIDYYELRKGSTWAGATVIGRISARFSTIFETTAGVYKYWIAGVDVAGNIGSQSNVDALVNQPPDYQLEFNQDSTFSGTKSNFVAFEQGFLTPVDTAETWEKHFNGGMTATTVFAAGVLANSAFLRTDNVAFSCDVVFPTTWSDGVLFELGATTYGAFVGIVGSGATFRLRAGDGSNPWTAAAVLDVATSTLPNDGNVHNLSWDFQINPGRVRFWVDGVLKGTGTYSGSLRDGFWAGTDDGGYGVVSSSGISGGGETTASWPGTLVSGLSYYQSQLVSNAIYASPSGQVAAGFPIYAMPSASASYYEEIVDYGAVLAATKISATLTYTSTAGTVTVTPKLSVRKLTTDPWTDYNGVSSVFVTDFRYAKIRFDFTGSGGDDLITVTGMNIRFDVKLKNDAGTAAAVSTDSGGTTVNFNVTFVDVESITVTPKGTAARIAVYDFVDAPNPTSFKVLLFDTAGNRVSGDVSWSVKGI